MPRTATNRTSYRASMRARPMRLAMGRGDSMDAEPQQLRARTPVLFRLPIVKLPNVAEGQPAASDPADSAGDMEISGAESQAPWTAANAGGGNRSTERQHSLASTSPAAALGLVDRPGGWGSDGTIDQQTAGRPQHSGSQHSDSRYSASVEYHFSESVSPVSSQPQVAAVGPASYSIDGAMPTEQQIERPHRESFRYEDFEEPDFHDAANGRSDNATAASYEESIPAVSTQPIPYDSAQPSPLRSWWEHWSSGVILILLIIALVTASILAFSEGETVTEDLLAESKATGDPQVGLPEIDNAAVELPGDPASDSVAGSVPPAADSQGQDALTLDTPTLEFGPARGGPAEGALDTSLVESSDRSNIEANTESQQLSNSLAPADEQSLTTATSAAPSLIPTQSAVQGANGLPLGDGSEAEDESPAASVDLGNTLTAEQSNSEVGYDAPVEAGKTLSPSSSGELATHSVSSAQTQTTRMPSYEEVLAEPVGMQQPSADVGAVSPTASQPVSTGDNTSLASSRVQAPMDSSLSEQSGNYESDVPTSTIPTTSAAPNMQELLEVWQMYNEAMQAESSATPTNRYPTLGSPRPTTNSTSGLPTDGNTSSGIPTGSATQFYPRQQ